MYANSSGQPDVNGILLTEVFGRTCLLRVRFAFIFWEKLKSEDGTWQCRVEVVSLVLGRA